MRDTLVWQSLLQCTATQRQIYATVLFCTLVKFTTDHDSNSGLSGVEQ